MTDRLEVQDSAATDLGIEFWRLRIYTAGFLVAFVLHLVTDGVMSWPALSLATIAALCWGTWQSRGSWLRLAVVLGVVHALVFPILQQAAATGQAISAVVDQIPLWPQLLVTLIGSRVLANEGKLAFIQFWRQPTQRQSAIEIQSFLSAIVFGAFLTLLFYMLLPYALSPAARQTSAIIVSAMLGNTVIHTAIIALFFVIVASIFDAALLHVVDRSLLSSFRRLVAKDRKMGARRDPAAILNEELGAAAHAKAFRILKAAIEARDVKGENATKLTALSFDGFQTASRQFVRTLLPFLPLLGFLGTVIGLSAAIAELPRGITDPGGQGFDFSASLAGLAIKFETTLLGLVASMICSLLLNFLEKREAELIAECMLVVNSAGERNV